MLLQTSDVKIKKISEKDNVGVFEFSPLPGGFGRTLGNSLRRVLLTSLSGSAVTEVRVPGVNHQFTTISGVKEDVIEITLNLKEIKVKKHTDEVLIGRISKKGKGPITAKDIEVTSDIEIINPDHYIAEISDDKTTVEMDLTFETGTGYSPVENRKTSKVGVVLIDSIFSPVTHVSYDVEDTRHGDETGLDKLTITVTTDGSVTPEDAVVDSATILRNFFSRFAKGPDPEELVVEEAPEVAAVTAASEEIFLEDLPLPTRTINALKKHGVNSLQELAKLSDDDLADVKNLGEKSVKEIQKILEKEGLK